MLQAPHRARWVYDVLLFCIRRICMDLALTKWNELCGVLEVPGDIAEKWWTCIRTSYQSTGRHYHTLTHISSMLSHLAEFKERIRCYEEVSLAIYFHELVSKQSVCVPMYSYCSIVYEPKAHDNEESSAALFMTFASECLEGVVSVCMNGISKRNVFCPH